jgi:hypothetical protein
MEEEFEVKGPHEKEVDEAIEEGSGLSKKIALMTAILATVGTIVSYKSGSAQNEAMFLKNESILKQTEASDQWAFYQAKSIKSHIDANFIQMATDQASKDVFIQRMNKENNDKEEVKKEAEKLQAESKKLGEESEAKLKPHERSALALSLIQIGIAIAAITVLTKRKELFWVSMGTGMIGVGMAISALLM